MYGFQWVDREHQLRAMYCGTKTQAAEHDARRGIPAKSNVKDSAENTHICPIVTSAGATVRGTEEVRRLGSPRAIVQTRIDAKS